MALNIIDTAYAGTFASYFWLPATFGMDTLQKGVAYVKDGIKKSHTIGRVDFTQPLQPRKATPTSGGTFNVDGRVLTPNDLMVYTEFNPRDYEQHWLAEELSRELLARELPVTAENYMMQIGLDRAFEQVELGLWMGSTTYTAAPGSLGNGQICFFDGFLKKMINDASVLQVASPLPLSALASDSETIYNIVDAFNALIQLVAINKKALLSRPSRYKRLKFIVSVNTEQIYQTFLTTTQTFKGVNTTDEGINKYKGYEVVALAGLPDNTILFTEALDDTSSNLYVGMNSAEDNNLQLQKLQANSELFFLKGLMKFDVQYGFSQQVFLYTTLTAASFNA
jgi:hypothetical protein